MNETELIQAASKVIIHTDAYTHIETRERSKYLRLDNKTMTKIRENRSNTMNINIFTNKE